MKKIALASVGLSTAIALMSLADTVLTGQSAPAAVFEVASVKRSDPQSRATLIDLPPGRFVMLNLPIRWAIRFAFSFREDGSPIAGAPPWVDDELYDINAKMPADAPSSERQAMLRALLAERFRLQARTESREETTYVVSRMAADTLGPQLRVSTRGCVALRSAAASGRGTLPNAAADGAAPCSIRSTSERWTGRGVDMAIIVRMLSNQTRTFVADRTSLGGEFDVDLEWAPQSTELNAGEPTAPSSGGPGFTTAVREQLGLKLESMRAPVPYLVIDHIERPTPD